jgi:hypothetical protein
LAWNVITNRSEKVNIFAYRKTPTLFQEPYSNGYVADSSFLRFAVYQDQWMDVWTKERMLDYCEPPSKKMGNVRIMLGDNTIPLQGQGTTTVAIALPWDMKVPVYIASNNWIAETDWWRRANRRIMIWLIRNLGYTGGLGFNAALCDPLGSFINNYSPFATTLALGGQAAASATLGRVDVNAAMAVKADVFPMIDAVASWNWITYGTDSLFANQVPLFFDLMTNITSVRVSRLLRNNETVTPVQLVPGNYQLKDPYEINMARYLKGLNNEGEGETTKEMQEKSTESSI